MEDSHAAYASFRHIESRREKKAYHPRMTRMPPPRLRIITGVMPAGAVHEKAAGLGVTVNEYLSRGALLCLLSSSETGSAPAPSRIKSASDQYAPLLSEPDARNFALFVNPGIEPEYGDYSFEEIVHHVHHFMRLRLNEQYLNAILSANVGNEKNPAVRPCRSSSRI